MGFIARLGLTDSSLNLTPTASRSNRKKPTAFKHVFGLSTSHTRESGVLQLHKAPKPAFEEWTKSVGGIDHQGTYKLIHKKKKGNSLPNRDSLR
ncbi:hypothetical protein CUMW_040850 [Citrus unshiu]|nr:hypothetical protein CUMW_040850 [Citrus unshiu]